MKHPKKLQIRPSKKKGDFAIYLWETFKEPGDVYRAKNAEELLAFLMGVYDWYPEGYEKEPWQAYVEGTIKSLGRRNEKLEV